MTTTSIFSSLFSTLDSSSISDIGSHLGESTQAVSHGLEAATASLITGLADKTADSTCMNQVFKLISEAPSKLNVADLANSVTAPNRGAPATSSLLDSGKSFLSLIFGRNQSSVFDAVGRSTGLRSNVITSLMGIAAPLLMTALGRMVREDRMSPAGLQECLLHERESVRGMLPAGFSDILKGAPAPDAFTRPVAIGTIAEPASKNWLWLIPALLLLPLLYWGWSRFRPATEVTREFGTPRATANLGPSVTQAKPGNPILNIPSYGIESQLLGFIQDPSKGVDKDVWFTSDRLMFDTGSANLRPASREQLRNIAAILTAYPNVHIMISGHTDSTGDKPSNLKLSQDRANGVMAELVTLGVSPDRMEAQGYREQFPAADNSTADGRAKNRRIAMNVTQK